MVSVLTNSLAKLPVYRYQLKKFSYNDLMRSSNIKYLPEIDHLRAYAAWLIIVYHGLHLFGWEFRFGTPFSFSEWPQTSNPIQVLLEGHTAVTFSMVFSGFILNQWGPSVSDPIDLIKAIL